MNTLTRFTAFHGVILYGLIRLISFFTPGHPSLAAAVSACLVVGFAWLAVKRLEYAWLILVSEIILGGAGHFLELFGFLLRTWFLAIFFLAWVIKKIRTRTFPHLPKAIWLTLGIFAFFLLLSIAFGLIHGHKSIDVLQDAMLYFFLLLIFPALDFKTKITPASAAVFAKIFIIGSALFSFVTLTIYASGLGTLPDRYYHWFRDIAAGKITNLGNHFFRIVLPENLFVVPIILVIATYLLYEPRNKKFWLWLQPVLFVLLLNFSRIYFLALAGGLIVLAYRQSLKRWFTVSAAILACMLVLFTSTELLVSRGQSLGLELLGLRVVGVTSPNEDVSGAIRLALLPNILQIMKQHPWFGSGLGTPVTFVHPVTHDVQTRTQFDWGYLELIAELGILGTLAFVAFLFSILFHLAKRAYTNAWPPTTPALYRGLLAGAVSLFVINLTTPALFQGFGIIFFVFALTALLMQRSCKSDL